MNKYKKIWLIVIVVISILALTNPTDSDFKNYLQTTGLKHIENSGRISYFLIFSIYKADVKIYGNRGTYIKDQHTYIGVFKNFISN